MQEFTTETQMKIHRSIVISAATGLSVIALTLALAGTAEARRVSRWNCPTGQTENVITGICEGPYTGAFMFVSPGYDYGGHHYRGWRHHMRHHGHHHHH
jgi:hypothetical protein